MKTKIRIFAVVLAIVIASVIGKLAMRGRDFLYAGTVEATKIDLSPRLGSVVSKFNAKEGQQVKAGETLVELASEDLELAAESTERDFLRAEKLLKSGSITREAYEHLKTKRDESEVKLSWAKIKSPVDATVLDIYREQGEWVSPGQKILTIANLSEVWATVYVPQPLLAKLSLNSSVSAYLPELDNKMLEGRITHISDEAEFTPKNVQTRAERTRLVYAIKITFKNATGILKPGMTIDVELPE